jgi:DNA-binding NarL/FixJ family response regulator
VVKSALAVELAIGDPELAERVRDILTESGGFEIAVANDQRRPQVLITDAAEESSQDLSAAAPVLVVTDSPKAADEALRLGATAVLSVDACGNALRAAVHAAALGLTTLSAEFRRHLVGNPGRPETEGDEDGPTAGLTARELQVLQLLAEGASNKAIARQLGITPNTAKFHVAAIAGKLGASGRTDTVAKAVRLGLILI